MKTLEHALEQSMKSGNVGSEEIKSNIEVLRSQCEVILMEQEKIHQNSAELKKIQELQKVLSSQHIADCPMHVDRINKIILKQQEQSAKIDQLVVQVNDIVLAYNKILSDLASWSKIWSQNDI